MSSALLGGVSLTTVAALLAPVTAVAQQRQFVSETVGANGRDGHAALIGGRWDATEGKKADDVRLINSFTNAGTPASSTSVRITATGGRGGHGDSAGFIEIDGARGGDGGNINVTQKGALSASGNQKEDKANLFVESRGGNGGTANESLGRGGNGGTVDLTVEAGITTQGDRFAGIWARSVGGNAGSGGASEGGISTRRGGDARRVSVSIGKDASITVTGASAAGVVAESRGGHGGDRGHPFYALPYTTRGGDGGDVNLVNVGQVTVTGKSSPGLLAQSLGGRGGNQATTSGGQPGAGGGTGGTVALLNTGRVVTAGDFNFGVLAQSLGGAGGVGGGGFFGGGDGGSAGSGGRVFAENYGTIETRGEGAIAILAQSMGGANSADGFRGKVLVPDAGGGSGGSSFVGWAGAGGKGGNGNVVTVTNAGVLSTLGEGAHGIFAQSLGGGGGNGGAVDSKLPFVSIAVGGRGGGGGNGGNVNVVRSTLPGTPTGTPETPSITTSGASAYGIKALSIGAGGGTGGSAAAKTAGVVASVSVAIGGAGGDGGNGGEVTVANDSNITTSGHSSIGISAKSIGGGGGVGGNASAYALAVAPVAAVPAIAITYSVGGTGGKGGNGARVVVDNFARIFTTGSSATGIEAISIGGGGGSGGTAESVSDMLSLYANVGLSVALGGNGDTGGSAGSVKANNGGHIETSGDFARGIVAMSTGGGGGKGGSGTASAAPGLSWHKQLQAAVKAGVPLADAFSANVAIGGKGGKGGIGQTVEVENTGLIRTHGDNAQGIFAQSVGGGGGDAGGMLVSGSGTLTGKLTIGGSGGAGGAGGTVNVTNGPTGVIETTGTGSAAIFAQSVGGGGGSGGAFSGSTSSPVSYDEAPAAFVVQVADEVLKLEKLLSSLLGNDSKKLQEYKLLDKNSPLQKKVSLASNLLKVVKVLIDEDKSLSQRILQAGGMAGAGFALQQLKKSLESAYEQWAKKDPVKLPNIGLSLSYGGDGGGGGIGGAVTIKNQGYLVTHGTNSWGVFAQSVGGGGGSGAAAMSTGENNINLDATMGGTGGNGGAGGKVSVFNDGDISTSGGASYGVFAQSVGGGGGVGGVTMNANTISISGGYRVGGSGGNRSDGGVVEVTNTGNVITGGREAHALVAQSIGGGGGVFVIGRVDPYSLYSVASNREEYEGLRSALEVLHSLGLADKPETALSNDGGGTQNKSNTIIPGLDIAKAIGGNGGKGGAGGKVTVEHSGQLQTSGAGAFGIFAQSIGGGGGMGADAGDRDWMPLKDASIGGSGGVGGNGGEVTLKFGNNATVTTTGAGATGVFVQSIGGGGGYGGVGIYHNSAEATHRIHNGNASGDGGAIELKMQNANDRLGILTQGDQAHAIFLQSIGGGGGAVTDLNGTVVPTGNQPSTGIARNGATGKGNLIKLETAGDIVATGKGSYGIFAQTGTQNTDGSIDAKRLSGQIMISHDGAIVGGSGTGAAIRLDGGVGNSVTLGTKSYLAAGSGTAIIGSAGADTIHNGGIVIGDLLFAPLAASKFLNDVSATYRTQELNGLVELGRGRFDNYGTFDIGGVGTLSSAQLNGTLASTGQSRLLVDVNSLAPAGQPKSDRLKVAGSVTLGGTIEVNVVVGLRRESFTVLDATGGISGSATAKGPGAWSPISWTAHVDQHKLTITPTANFTVPAGVTMTSTENEVRQSLQEIWNTYELSDFGAQVYGVFSQIGSALEYKNAIDSLSPEESAGTLASQVVAARTSMNSALSCPVFAGAGTELIETDCAWSRISAAHAQQNDSASSAGYGQSVKTLRIGAQHEVSDNWYFGATAGYTSSKLNDNQRYSTTYGDAFDTSVSVKYETGPWLFGLVGQLGYGHYETNRTLDFGGTRWTTSGTSRQLTAGARFRAERQFAFENWYVRPYADVDLLYTWSPAHRETGQFASFSFDAAESWNAAFSPNIEFGSRLDLEDGWLRPYASVGMTALARDRVTINGSLDLGAGDDGFSVHSRVPDLLFNISAGLQFYRSNGLELRGEYKASFAKDYVAQEGGLRLSIPF